MGRSAAGVPSGWSSPMTHRFDSAPARGVESCAADIAMTAGAGAVAMEGGKACVSP